MKHDVGLWRVDMHCHTNHSPDCLMPPAALARAAVRAGLDALFVTDHERQSAVEAVREAAGDRLRVFAGQEIRTRRGEVIGLFVRRRVPTGLEPDEAIEAIHAQGGLAYLPHPFARVVPSKLRRAAIERLADRFDVVEAVNARNILRRDDRRAASFARARGLGLGAGSDSHWPWELGRAFVEMPPFDGPEDFLESLAAGRLVDRAKSSYLVSGVNAAVYPCREAWWRLNRDRRAAPVYPGVEVSR